MIWGMIKSFWEIIREEKIKNNTEKCPHGAYTCQGPQGSINICVALVCLNMALNLELFICVCICICEAFKRYLSMELSVMKIIGVDFVVV